MPFHVVGISTGASQEPQAALLAEGRLSLGQIDLGSSPLDQPFARYGAEVFGVWQSTEETSQTYLVVEGEMEENDALEIAADAGLQLVDFRAIVVGSAEGGPAEEEIRARLSDLTVAIGPATDACELCGGYGIHFSPPHEHHA